MSASTQEWRHALRGLLRRPLASATAVLTLALALAASAVLLLVVHALYLAPLPWSNHERLVYIGTEMSRIGVPDARMSWALVHELDQLPALEQSAGYRVERVAVQRGELPESVQATRAEAALFTLLGAGTVALGRGFSEAEVTGDEPVLVLSHAAAREWFAEPQAALDQSISVAGRPHRVIGVLAANADFPDRQSRLLLPLKRPVRAAGVDGNFGVVESMGLLASGVEGTASLAAQLDAMIERMTIAEPDFRGAREITGLRMLAKSWRERRAGDVGATLVLLASALSGLLLLAACNVSGVLMERVVSRRGELSVRMALGASRLRLLRLVLVDALLLSLCGWVLGLALAFALIAILPHWLWLDSVVAVGVDVATVPIILSLLLTVLLSLVTAVFPALSVARLDMGRSAMAQRGGSDGRAQRARRLLVTGQTAISLSLLVVALLLVRSLIGLWQVDPGFAREGVLTAEIEPAGDRYAQAQARGDLAGDLIAMAKAIPGVETVGVADAVPFGRGYSLSAYEVEGRTDPEQPPVAYRSSVGGDYFQAMGMRLRRGRGFSAEEQRDPERRVAIIDQSMAERYYPDIDAIGQRLRFMEEDWLEIIGVVGSVHQADLADAGDSGQIYLPLAAQVPDVIQLVLRSPLPSQALIPGLREGMAGIDGGLVMQRVLSMQQRVDDSLSDRAGPMRVVAFFAGLALLLAGIGLYGLLATSVVERRAEIGVRMALGADRRHIITATLTDGLRLVAVGLVLGLLVAAALVPLLRHQLYGVGAADPVSHLLAVALLLGIAVLAAAVPAWRAGRVAPATALRNE